MRNGMPFCGKKFVEAKVSCQRIRVTKAILLEVAVHTQAPTSKTKPKKLLTDQTFDSRTGRCVPLVPILHTFRIFVRRRLATATFASSLDRMDAVDTCKTFLTQWTFVLLIGPLFNATEAELVLATADLREILLLNILHTDAALGRCVVLPFFFFFICGFILDGGRSDLVVAWSRGRLFQVGRNR